MSEIYVVQVELENVHPRIWRKLEIRVNATFWALHCAIQNVMPWQDYHLHEFRFPVGDVDMQIGIVDPGPDLDLEFLTSWGSLVKDWFPSLPSQCLYVYDFGDNWQHRVTLQERKEGRQNVRYPHCVGGEGRCPPEDVGGIPGFTRFKEAMADPEHEEHQDLIDWFGSVWKELKFDPGSVKFSSPTRRLREAGLGQE